MARPFVKDDTFWGDVINGCLLRPPYRKELDPEYKKAKAKPNIVVTEDNKSKLPEEVVEFMHQMRSEGNSEDEIVLLVMGFIYGWNRRNE